MSDHSPRPEPQADTLLASYDGLICDLDGVVHRGQTAVAGAPHALSEAVARGTRVVFATNNASRPPSEVSGHLARLGFPAGEIDVVTSAQAGAAHLRRTMGPGAQVLALGGPGVAAALEERQLVPVEPGQGPAEAVLQGYGPALTVADFTEAARLIASGVAWVATNTDLTIPVEWGAAPGNGAYVELLARMTGRQPDASVGKPAPPLYDLAIERLGVGRARVLAVGDRLDTDIDGAAAAGVDSAWVLTGVHGPSDLVASAERAVPTYVIASLRQLHEPYAAAHPSGDGWACGAYRCSVETLPDNEVRLVDQSRVAGGLGAESGPPGGAEAIHVVRAGLAALVEARDAGRAPLDAFVRAARRLDAVVAGAER